MKKLVAFPNHKVLTNIEKKRDYFLKLQQIVYGVPNKTFKKNTLGLIVKIKTTNSGTINKYKADNVSELY